MKVLGISSYGVLGGAELALIDFAANRPAHVDLSVLLVEDGPLKDKLAAHGVQTFAGSENYDGRPSPAAMVRFSRSLGRLLQRVKPDVVWATGLKAAFMAVPACKAAKRPLVWHKVDFSLDGVLTLPLASAVDGVVCVSEAVGRALGPLRAKKLLGVTGTPVRLDPDLWVQPDPTKPTIGTLGTLIPIKGQKHIVEAGALLAKEFPELKILLVGSQSQDHPHYLQELLGLAASLEIAKRVEIRGFVEDVSQVLGELTVFVNATYRAERNYGREGLGSSMLEAGWAGLPVVATRGGGSPEGMRDGVTGTLVEPDDPKDMARALQRYLSDPQLARKAGQAGRIFTRENFAPKVVTERLFKALEAAT